MLCILTIFGWLRTQSWSKYTTHDKCFFFTFFVVELLQTFAFISKKFKMSFLLVLGWTRPVTRLLCDDAIRFFLCVPYFLLSFFVGVCLTFFFIFLLVYVSLSSFFVWRICLMTSFLLPAISRKCLYPESHLVLHFSLHW